MSNEMSLFEGQSNALVNSDLFKSLMETNKNLAGGGGGAMPRISIRGMRFRQVIGGEQVQIRKEDFLDVVILDAAPVSRTYYEGKYDPENPQPPKCWSSDSTKPDASVPDDQKQAPNCASCPQNIKGSGQGTSRACRFGQRLAVAVDGDMETVYQMQLPAASIFGAAENGNMPMQAYAKLLAAHKTPPIAVVTRMFFDENSETPKLFFKPERPLTEAELNTAVSLKDHPDVERALELTVAQVDGVQAAAPKPAPKTNNVLEESEAPKAEAAEEPVEEPVEEPKKAEKKAEPKAENEDLLKSLEEWDDD